LPPRDPPLWFNALMTAAVAFVCLFATALVITGLVTASGPILKHLRHAGPQQAAPQKSQS
jgi:hypothetical protein